MQLRIIDRSYWIIDGLRFADYRTGGIAVEALGANIKGVTIQNCTLQNQRATTNAGGWLHAIVFNGNEPFSVSYSYILNNRLTQIYQGSPNGQHNEIVTLHHNVTNCLVQGNYLNEGTYIGLNAVGGDWSTHPTIRGGKGFPHRCVFRNNIVDYIVPSNYGARSGQYVDCGYEILIEGNLFRDCNGPAPSAENWNSSAKGQQLEYGNIIVRNNVIDGSNGRAYIGVVFGADEREAFLPMDRNAVQRWVVDSVFVHNVVRNVRQYSIYLENVKRGRIRNNVVDGAGDRLVATRPGSEQPDLVMDGNLYYDDSSPRWQLGSRAFTSIAQWRDATGHDRNSIFAKPAYNSENEIIDGTPGSGAAVPLTTTARSGTASNQLAVRDARYFCNGYGVIPGDRIKVDGAEAVVTAVNYAQNVLVLDRALSWEQDARVDYYYAGTAPSIGLTGGISTGAPITPPEPNPEPEWVPLPAIACEDNLVLNGVFADGGTGWQWFTAGNATYRIVDGMARVSVSSSGRNTQLYQSGLSVIEGNQYSIAFAARSAQTPKKFTVTLHEHEAPYTGLGLFETVEITAEGEIYSFQFVARQSSDNARLRFAFEETNEEIGIDNVCFSLVGEGPEPELPPYRIIETGARIGVLLGL